MWHSGQTPPQSGCQAQSRCPTAGSCPASLACRGVTSFRRLRITRFTVCHYNTKMSSYALSKRLQCHEREQALPLPVRPSLRTVCSLVALKPVFCVCRLARRPAQRGGRTPAARNSGGAAGSTGGALAAPAPATPVAGSGTVARCRPAAPCVAAHGYHPRGAAYGTKPDRCGCLGPPPEPFLARGSRRHAAATRGPVTGTSTACGDRKAYLDLAGDQTVYG